MVILLILLGFYLFKFNIGNFKSKINKITYLKYFFVIIIFSSLFYSIINLVSNFSTQNLEITFLGIDILYVNQLFFILFGIIVILVIFTKFVKNNFISLILTNLLFPLLLSFSFYLLRNSTVPISEFLFELGYLSLISTLFMIFLVPFVLIKNFDLGNSKKKRVSFLLFQIFSLFIFVILLKLDFILSIIYILSTISLVLLKNTDIIRRIMYVIITAALISVIINISFSDLKKGFVSSNLNRIFLNQENYSKLVIGEIIEEFELSKIRLKSFFNSKNKAINDNILADIWNHSIASTESIVSGIYVLDKERNIINQFSYKIPYLNVKPTLELPVWTTEETDGTLYGKELSVSFGSIKVNDNAEHLGYIVIQVINSPEMILRNSGLTIFGLDRKLKNAKLNYLKLKDHKIIENPLNINLNNLVEIINYKDKWFNFSFMENWYEGYRFISGEHSIIIFSPKKSFIEWIAEIIKISILFMVIFILMSANEIKKNALGFIYYSLSSRIFIILTSLSLISIILFSIFTINYNNQTVQSGFRNKILKNGRIAQNLIGQLLEDSGELTQNDVFFIANIIDNDIHVYYDNELFFSSNYKEINDLKIPKYIHSNTIEMFGSEKQSYYIEGEKDNFNLYFKIYKYIFCVNFTFNEKDYNFGKNRSFDFIISLFFLLLLGSLIIVIIVRNKIMAPILFLNKKMSEVEKGDLKRIEYEPVEIELKTLYSGFNSMVIGVEEQKKNASDISRMKTVIKLGRRVAHEVKNPLTPIKLSAEQILKSINDKKENYEDIIKKSVKYIVSETDHLKKVSHGFLDLSHIDEIAKKNLELISLIEDQIVLFKQSYPSINFKIEKDMEKININLDRLKITQLFKNVILNSIEAIDKDKGLISVIINKNENFINIAIKDNGVGLNESEMDLLFEEDYSTKENGTGIGLFVAKRIIELHNGKIEIKPGISGGTIVLISLPV